VGVVQVCLCVHCVCPCCAVCATVSTTAARSRPRSENQALYTCARLEPDGSSCVAQPQDAYGLEKLASEELAMHYDKDFALECRIARFHNIYGPYGTWKGGREKAPAAFCRKVGRLALRSAPVCADGPALVGGAARKKACAVARKGTIVSAGVEGYLCLR